MRRTTQTAASIAFAAMTIWPALANATLVTFTAGPSTDFSLALSLMTRADLGAREPSGVFSSVDIGATFGLVLNPFPTSFSVDAVAHSVGFRHNASTIPGESSNTFGVPAEAKTKAGEFEGEGVAGDLGFTLVASGLHTTYSGKAFFNSFITQVTASHVVDFSYDVPTAVIAGVILEGTLSIRGPDAMASLIAELHLDDGTTTFTHEFDLSDLEPPTPPPPTISEPNSGPLLTLGGLLVAGFRIRKKGKIKSQSKSESVRRNESLESRATQTDPRSLSVAVFQEVATADVRR